VTEQQHSRPGTARFELAYRPGEAELSADDHLYAATVRRRAASWEGVEFDTFTDTWEDDDDRTGVIAGFDLPVIGLVGAAHVRGRLHCGPVHPHLTHFWCPWSPGLEYDEHGSPEALAHQAADWFEALLRRPVVLWLWQAGQSGPTPACYAGRYEFADDGDLIAEWYDSDCAPAVETARARQGGYFVESWLGPGLTTETLTHPDAFQFVRGDRSAARIPGSCHELPSGHAVGRREETRLLGCDLRWDTRRAHDLGLRRRCLPKRES
jgi:hypothetical protein